MSILAGLLTFHFLPTTAERYSRTMAPILIDSRDILKLGFITVLATMLIFVVGFLLGHQQAATFYQAGSHEQLLPLPEKAVALANITDSQVPAIIEAGENIDVDQPKTIAKKNNAIKNLKQNLTHVPVAEAITSSQNKKLPTTQKSEQNKAKIVVESKTTKVKSSLNDNNQVSKKIVSVSMIDKAKSDVVELDALAASGKIKYSIQVGVYGRLVNAEDVVKKLQAKQYDAYITDYTNKKNEVRYNVRLGYFVDKKSAIATLKKFKASKKGDGYLVKFSADNIVNVAGTSAIKKVIDVPAGKHKTSNTLEPTTVPSNIVEDEISKVEVQPSDVVNNIQITSN